MTFSYRAALAALVVAGLSGEAVAQGSASAKIAVFNGTTVMQQAPGSAEAQAMLARETAAFQAEVDRMSDSLKLMQKAYQDDEAGLSPAARTQRQRDLETRLTAYTRRQDSLRTLAGRRQQDLLQPVMDLVNKVIQDIRNEEGYALMHDLSAEGNSIVAHDKNLDITDRILARVKRQPPPKLPETILKSAAPPIRPPPIKPPTVKTDTLSAG